MLAVVLVSIVRFCIILLSRPIAVLCQSRGVYGIKWPYIIPTGATTVQFYYTNESHGFLCIRVRRTPHILLRRLDMENDQVRPGRMITSAS
jgi:hypothetical protein